MILMLALALILFVINIVAGERIGYSPMVVTFNTFVFAAYFVLAASAVVYAVRTYRREAAISMRQASLESMQKYTEQVENLYNSMRAFKHDYVNIIATMYGYIENREYRRTFRVFYRRNPAPDPASCPKKLSVGAPVQFENH